MLTVPFPFQTVPAYHSGAFRNRAGPFGAKHRGSAQRIPIGAPQAQRTRLQ